MKISHASSIRPLKSNYLRMKTITKQADNMGGVVRLWAIPRTDISLNGNIPTIASSDNVVCMDLTQDSAAAEHIPKVTFAGTTYLHEISGFIPGYSEDTEPIINEMMRLSRYVVIYLDSEGVPVLLGRPDIPIRFNAAFATGQTTASPRGYKISFSGNVHYPPIRLQSNPFD